MSGDINAINCWARSVATQARAIAMNTGCSVSEARERLISRGKDTRAKHTKTRTGK